MVQPSVPMAGAGVLGKGVEKLRGAGSSPAPILALLCVDEEAFEDKWLVSG